jgi:hypothetical protein
VKGAHKDTLGLLRLGVWESPIPYMFMYCIYPDYALWLGGHIALVKFMPPVLRP